MARIERKQGGHVSKHPSTTKRALLRAKDYDVQGRMFRAVEGSVKAIDPKRVQPVFTKVGSDKSSKVFLSLMPQTSVKKS